MAHPPRRAKPPQGLLANVTPLERRLPCAKKRCASASTVLLVSPVYGGRHPPAAQRAEVLSLLPGRDALLPGRGAMPSSRRSIRAGSVRISPSRITIRSSLRVLGAGRRSLLGLSGSGRRSRRTMPPGRRSLEAASASCQQGAPLCLLRAALWNHRVARGELRVARGELREARCKGRSAPILRRSSRIEHRASQGDESVPPCLHRSTRPELRVSPWRLTAEETKPSSTNKNTKGHGNHQSRRTCPRLAAASHLRPRPRRHGAGHRARDDERPFLPEARSSPRDGRCRDRGAPDRARRRPGEERAGLGTVRSPSLPLSLSLFVQSAAARRGSRPRGRRRRIACAQSPPPFTREQASCGHLRQTRRTPRAASSSALRVTCDSGWVSRVGGGVWLARSQETGTLVLASSRDPHATPS